MEKDPNEVSENTPSVVFIEDETVEKNAANDNLNDGNTLPNSGPKVDPKAIDILRTEHSKLMEANKRLEDDNASVRLKALQLENQLASGSTFKFSVQFKQIQNTPVS